MKVTNRDAVITIQGGGVYGLTLLGQLQAVIEQHGYAPLALAGTSAGAIVATLVWSGLRPKQIRDHFHKMVTDDPNSLIGLLGPFDPPPETGLDFPAFLNLKKTCGSAFTILSRGSPGSVLNPLNWPSKIGALREKSGVVSDLKNQALPHLIRRGFFAGDLLEQKIEELLRLAHDVPSDITPPGDPLRFCHFTSLMEKNKDDSYRPPLLLTITNLTKRRLEVINSVDQKYMNVPIAKIVRASAGFPVFFRPKDLPECPGGGWFVDGGVVSNFPGWVFSDAFRQLIQGNSLYRHLAPKPWIRIGLRVVDDVTTSPDLKDPKLFFMSLFAMLTGQARNELEEILATRAPRPIIIKQPLNTTYGPENILAIGDLNADKIDSMVTRGFEFADEHLKRLGTPGIYCGCDEGKVGRSVQQAFETLVDRCLMVLNCPPGNVKLRANVFIPVEDRLKLLYSYNMERDDDRTMEFPDQESGLTGFCYSSRRPQVCNLQKVSELRTKQPEVYNNLFGMDPILQGKVRADRSWLASVPIFDPYELRFAPNERREAGSLTLPGKAYHGVDTEFDGPVLGVLNIDAGWDYALMKLDPDPDIHFEDKRIQAMLSLMESTAFSLADALVEVFHVEGGTL